MGRKKRGLNFLIPLGVGAFTKRPLPRDGGELKCWLLLSLKTNWCTKRAFLKISASADDFKDTVSTTKSRQAGTNQGEEVPEKLGDGGVCPVL